MKAIKISVIAFFSLFSILWLLADSLIPNPFNYFSFRQVFMQFSGIIAIAAMSFAMLLALRSVWLEPHLNGLDKMYRLHKWLGITAVITSVLHWWFAQGTKWMVSWGWLTRPQHGKHGPETLTGIDAWLHGQRELAEFVGEWAFYAFAILAALALIKRFPYHLFTKTHKWMALFYLVLVYHSFILVKPEYWSQAIGWLLMPLLVAGTLSALWILAGKLGANRKVAGEIDSLQYYPNLDVMETRVLLAEGWPGHKAGQFAFVTSDKKEGAHPYTIASAWNSDDPHIVFITKALGDHTSRLRKHLKMGMSVIVEGPYGCFDFEDTPSRQIWVGAGIGITPFVAKLKEMALIPGPKTIDLFHPTADFEPAALEKLRMDATAAGVTLHILVDEMDGRLDGKAIRSAISDWQQASIWFCGPPAFGHALKRDFVDQGFSAEHFHQELFQMR